MKVRVLFFALASGMAACASSQSGLQRALDPSMERVLRTESYLWTVSGITGHPERLMRSDGYIYMSDMAPVMRYLTLVQDTSRFLTLRKFVQANMLSRDASGLLPWRRFRDGARFERATPYGDRFLRQALNLAWHELGDTVSGELLARVPWFSGDEDEKYSESYRLAMRCADAVDLVSYDVAVARATLRDANSRFDRIVAENVKRGDSRVEAGELDLASCLTRLAIMAGDPDATVRYLDRTLDIVAPLLVHSGRPDLGTTADVLLTLRLVRQKGPAYHAVIRSP